MSLVGQTAPAIDLPLFGEGSIEPFFSARLFAFDLVAKLVQFPARELVILVKILAFAIDGGTPVATGRVVPWLFRTWSSHCGASLKNRFRFLTESPKQPTLVLEFRVLFRVRGSVGVFQFDVSPYRITVGAM